MYLFSPSSKKKVFLLLGDILIVLITFYITVFIKIKIFEPFNFKLILPKFNWWAFTLISLSPIIFYIFELYNKSRWENNTKLLLYISFAVLITSSIVAFLSYIFVFNMVIGRAILLFYSIFSILLLFAWRKLFVNVFSKSEYIKEKVLLIGDGAIVNDIDSIVKTYKIIPYDLKIIRNYSENPGTDCVNDSISTQSLSDMVVNNKFNTIVVACSLNDFPLLRKWLFDMKFSGIAIYDALYFYEALSAKIPIGSIKDSWFLFHNQGKKFNPFLYSRIKRIMDILFSLCGIIILSPLMLLISLAIKLSSKGPIFFRQERLGQNEKPFTILKFRTMIDNAEKATGPKWSDKNDPRVTKVGRPLRKCRFDELPQLFNILKGEMSFIGTRPIRKYFAEKLAKDIPYYRLRFIIKPGLTGWAQVQGRYFDNNEEQKEKLEYDLFYIQNQSLFFDLFIVLKTVSTVLFWKGQ
ncbi:MAG: sugar transferase [Candidatus Jettenia sp.]|nr:MAG: sugar transferase [Candidatus Jettenia sp.]